MINWKKCRAFYFRYKYIKREINKNKDDYGRYGEPQPHLL